MAGTGLTGFLQNLSGGEMVVIAIVALVVLGPDRLPEMARSAGKMIHKVRTMTEGLQSEVRDVMADPAMQPLKELGELAARPRQKLTEYALEAEAEERARKESAQADAAQAASDAAAEPGSVTGADDEPAQAEPTPTGPEPTGPEPADTEPAGPAEASAGASAGAEVAEPTPDDPTAPIPSNQEPG